MEPVLPSPRTAFDGPGIGKVGYHYELVITTCYVHVPA